MGGFKEKVGMYLLARHLLSLGFEETGIGKSIDDYVSVVNFGV